MPGKAEDGDAFGTPASGDFDRDGYADLAVGVPGESVGTRVGAGGVEVLYGSRDGLRSRGSRFFTQATRGVPGTAQADDRFGAALVAGDFDGDGRDDLAVAAPRDTHGPGPYDRGSVTVLLGSRKGLTTSGAQKLDSGTLIPDGVGAAGYSLDAADVDGDGRDELVVQASGRLALLVGSPTGLSTEGGERWDDARVGIGQVLPKAGTISSATFGDFDGDGHADLAVGSLGANVSGDDFDDCSVLLECGGAVAILPGTGDATHLLTTVGRAVLHPGNLPLSATIDFGRALAAGDLNGDGRDELCVGTGNLGYARALVVVTFEHGPGIEVAGSRSWDQEPGQVEGVTEAGDLFAETLQVAQRGRGPEADLAVGIPGEAVDGLGAAGRVAVLYGSSSGIRAVGQQSWDQDSAGVKGTAADGNLFGTLGR